jgi:cytochrome c heme-lyase
MDTVVAIHNNMNENTWRQILAWEDLHKEEVAKVVGGEPKLLRFTGRPDELSPKARIKTILGSPPPFDRHDWIVDRGGKEVRYVIDYYHDEAGVSLDKKPAHLQDQSSFQSIKVDVRPALDSIQAITDRLIFMPWLLYQGKTYYSPLPFFSLPNLSIMGPSSTTSKPATAAIDSKQVKKTMAEIQGRCNDYKLALKTCKSEVECAGAAMNLQRCAASVICPDIVKEYDQVIKTIAASSNADDSNRIDRAFEKISLCLDDFQTRSTSSS